MQPLRALQRTTVRCGQEPRWWSLTISTVDDWRKAIVRALLTTSVGIGSWRTTGADWVNMASLFRKWFISTPLFWVVDVSRLLQIKLGLGSHILDEHKLFFCHPGGNQRELARMKNAKKSNEQGKGKRNEDGLSAAARKQRYVSRWPMENQWVYQYLQQSLYFIVGGVTFYFCGELTPQCCSFSLLLQWVSLKPRLHELNHSYCWHLFIIYLPAAFLAYQRVYNLTQPFIHLK